MMKYVESVPPPRLKSEESEEPQNCFNDKRKPTKLQQYEETLEVQIVPSIVPLSLQKLDGARRSSDKHSDDQL